MPLQQSYEQQPQQQAQTGVSGYDYLYGATGATNLTINTVSGTGAAQQQPGYWDQNQANQQTWQHSNTSPAAVTPALQASQQAQPNAYGSAPGIPQQPPSQYPVQQDQQQQYGTPQTSQFYQQQPGHNASSYQQPYGQFGDTPGMKPTPVTSVPTSLTGATTGQVFTRLSTHGVSPSIPLGATPSQKDVSSLSTTTSGTFSENNSIPLSLSTAATTTTAASQSQKNSTITTKVLPLTPIPESSQRTTATTATTSATLPMMATSNMTQNSTTVSTSPNTKKSSSSKDSTTVSTDIKKKSTTEKVSFLFSKITLRKEKKNVIPAAPSALFRAVIY